MKSVVAIALLTGALVTGCGQGDDAPAKSDNPVGSIGGTKASGNDDGSGGYMLGVFAKQMAGSLAGGKSYTIKDGAVTIQLGADPGISSAASHCQIAVTARDGILDTAAPIRLEYADGVVEDCDKRLLDER